MPFGNGPEGKRHDRNGTGRKQKEGGSMTDERRPVTVTTVWDEGKDAVRGRKHLSRKQMEYSSNVVAEAVAEYICLRKMEEEDGRWKRKM